MPNSEGSKPDSSNIRKDYDHDTLTEHAPDMTDHKFEIPKHPLRSLAGTPEAERRAANRQRDNSRRWGVVNSPEGTQDRNVPGE
jgi:hypothetical protein